VDHGNGGFMNSNWRRGTDELLEENMIEEATGGGLYFGP